MDDTKPTEAPKRGRPRDPTLPREQLWFRASKKERAAYERAARAAGIDKLAIWIRATLNMAARKEG